MRICFVSRRYWPAVSGMSVYAENLLRHLVRVGHDVTLVSQYRGDPVGRGIYGGGPPPPARVPDGVRVVALESVGEQETVEGRPADFEADVEAMTRTVVALHAERPFDVLHAQYAYPNGLAVLRAAADLGLPAVVSVQGGDGHWVGTCCTTHRTLVRAVFAQAPALLIGSASFASEVTERHGVDPSRWTVVPGATDTERFVPPDASDVTSPDASDGTSLAPSASIGTSITEVTASPTTLLYHGRVDARKGVLDLLDAVALLRDEGRDVRLVVSGIGPDTDAVAARVTALGLDDVVEQLGYTAYDDAPSVYARGDVFVSPTYAEGFSNTILEAMACGLPVVSTDVVGVRDCVRHEENGILVPPQDAAALAAGIARVLDDDVLRAGIAARALDEVRERWSWPVVAGSLTSIYDTVRGVVPPAIPEVPVDPTCRFRSAPHLL